MTTTVLDRTENNQTVPGGGGLPGAIASEWIKLWSLRSVWWAVLGSALLMAATAGQQAIYAANANTDGNPANDRGLVSVGGIAISSVSITQFAVLALALLVMTGEYSAGTIGGTLLCTPSRGRLLLAKATVVGTVTFVLGVLLGAVGAAVADPVLGRWAAVPARGTVGDALAVGTYLMLISLFALGLGAALRGTVLTLVAVFVLVTVLPAALGLADPPVFGWLADATPAIAGQHFMTGDHAPYPPALGLVLLAGWAVAALVAGVLVLRRRDA